MSYAWGTQVPPKTTCWRKKQTAHNSDPSKAPWSLLCRSNSRFDLQFQYAWIVLVQTCSNTFSFKGLHFSQVGPSKSERLRQPMITYVNLPNVWTCLNASSSCNSAFFCLIACRTHACTPARKHICAHTNTHHPHVKTVPYRWFGPAMQGLQGGRSLQ